MGNEEIRRRKTAEPEIDAMVVIAQAFDGMDDESCQRVLRWADDRYGVGDYEARRRRSDKMLTEWMQNMSAAMEQFNGFCAKLGKPPIEVMSVLHGVYAQTSVEARERVPS